MYLISFLNCASSASQVAINLMVTQLLGVSSDSEVNEISRLFYDFVDGCLSIPINLPGFAYYTAMKVTKYMIASPVRYPAIIY